MWSNKLAWRYRSPTKDRNQHAFDFTTTVVLGKEKLAKQCLWDSERNAVQPTFYTQSNWLVWGRVKKVLVMQSLKVSCTHFYSSQMWSKPTKRKTRIPGVRIPGRGKRNLSKEREGESLGGQLCPRGRAAQRLPRSLLPEVNPDTNKCIDSGFWQRRNSEG